MRHSTINIPCPFCNSKSVIKHGQSHGHQRYRCNECKKTFSETHHTILNYTKKDYETWLLYIECMFQGKNLAEAAEECGISIATAFYWRHKILAAIIQMENQNELAGDLELETTFLRANYKGNKKNVPKPKLYLGISSAINENGQTKSQIASINRMSEAAADYALSVHIKGNSEGFTDKNVFGSLASKKNITLSKTKNKTFHVRKIQAYHLAMSDFFTKFRGVSSKYLENYLAWFDLKEITEEDYARITRAAVSIKENDIINKPAIPKIPYNIRKQK